MKKIILFYLLVFLLSSCKKDKSETPETQTPIEPS